MDIPPILQLSFNRSNKTADVLARLQRFGAKEIFISIDGPRREIESDKLQVKNVRSVAAEFEHNNVVVVRYRPCNTGLRSSVESAIDWFFSQNEYGIIIEDDIIFDHKFLNYCTQNCHALVNKSIATISGNNLLAHRFPEVITRVFRLAQIFHCWGWATSKEVWCEYRRYTRHFDKETLDNIVLKLNNSAILSPHIKALWIRMAKIYISDQDKSWAFPFMIYCVANNLRHLTPPVNLSSNNGFSKDASNTTVTPWYMNDIQTGENFNGELYATKAFVDEIFDNLEYQYIMACSSDDQI